MLLSNRYAPIGLNATPKEHQRRAGGRFAEEAKPPARPVRVYLPEPLLERLDAYGRQNGTGRGRSITALLKDLLHTPNHQEVSGVSSELQQKNLKNYPVTKRAVQIEFVGV